MESSSTGTLTLTLTLALIPHPYPDLTLTPQPHLQADAGSDRADDSEQGGAAARPVIPLSARTLTVTAFGPTDALRADFQF